MAFALALALALAACGGSDDQPAPPPAPGATPSTAPATTSTRAPEEQITFDWVERPTLELPGGWTVSACEGEAPLACVTRDGEPVGFVEQLGFPVQTLPDVQEALDEGLDPEQVLRLFATDELEALEEDRRAGCDPEYRVRPIGPAAAPVAGRPGLRYGFEGVDGAGAVVERISKHALLTEEALFLVVASGLEPDGCLPAQGEFRVGVLEEFEPQLARVVAGSRFLPPTEPGP